jgi:hypothetical protein
LESGSGVISLKDLKEHHYTKCPRPLFYKNINEGMSLRDRVGLAKIRKITKKPSPERKGP